MSVQGLYLHAEVKAEAVGGNVRPSLVHPRTQQLSQGEVENMCSGVLHHAAQTLSLHQKKQVLILLHREVFSCHTTSKVPPHPHGAILDLRFSEYQLRWSDVPRNLQPDGRIPQGTAHPKKNTIPNVNQSDYWTIKIMLEVIANLQFVFGEVTLVVRLPTLFCIEIGTVQDDTAALTHAHLWHQRSLRVQRQDRCSARRKDWEGNRVSLEPCPNQALSNEASRKWDILFNRKSESDAHISFTFSITVASIRPQTVGVFQRVIRMRNSSALQLR